MLKGRIKPIPELPSTASLLPGFIRHPSRFFAQKLGCDLQMLFLFRRRLRERKYDLIHAVEESVFMARFAQPAGPAIPYVYD